MSTSIRIEEDQLLSEIEGLLEKGEIKGKIDLIDKVSPSRHREAEGGLPCRYYMFKHQMRDKQPTLPLWQLETTLPLRLEQH